MTTQNSKYTTRTHNPGCMRWLCYLFYQAYFQPMRSTFPATVQLPKTLPCMPQNPLQLFLKTNSTAGTNPQYKTVKLATAYLHYLAYMVYSPS